jgi:hypothetical protein
MIPLTNCQFTITRRSDKMKILLQNRETLHYLQSVGTWTREDGDAHNFLHSQRAIDFAHEQGLGNVYVTVKFLGGDPDVSVPVPPPSLLSRSSARIY